MAIKILMPSLSPTMKAGKINKWLIKIGDKVSSGDIIAEIETDKATMEVEAADEGTITHLIDSDSETNIPINTPIALINGVETDSLKINKTNDWGKRIVWFDTINDENTNPQHQNHYDIYFIQ